MTKDKASLLMREKARTGGGGMNAVECLTPAEERVIGVIGEESIAGIVGRNGPQ